MSIPLTDAFFYGSLVTYHPDSDAPKMAVFMGEYDDLYLSKDVVETLLMPESVDRGGDFNSELLIAWEAFEDLAP